MTFFTNYLYSKQRSMITEPKIPSNPGCPKDFRFLPEAQRGAVAAEVAWVLNRTLETWGAWNRRVATPGGSHRDWC